MIPNDEGLGGWLGQYQKAIHQETVDLMQRKQAGQERDRHRSPDLEQ
jgi:hypothetical protein